MWLMANRIIYEEKTRGFTNVHRNGQKLSRAIGNEVRLIGYNQGHTLDTTYAVDTTKNLGALDTTRCETGVVLSI